MASPTAVSHHGRWEPLPHLLFASAVFPFQPVVVEPRSLDVKGKGKASVEQDGAVGGDAGAGGAKGELILANTHQVPLEVGDDCYAFERYIPSDSGGVRHGTEAAGAWYRGYVFSGSQQSTLSHASPPQTDFGTSSPSDDAVGGRTGVTEAQVFIGIFPASHVQVRERIDDAERRLSALHSGSSALEGTPPASQASTSRSATRSLSSRRGPMEPLHEEDETEHATPRTSGHMTTSPSSRFGLGMRRSRLSNNSISTELISPQMSPSYSRSSPASPVGPVRPAPPLPSLKAGDETMAGSDEPLIDEIACALREWYALLYVHLQRRRYDLFRLTKSHIEGLHTGRRQLLAQTLSTDEVAKLRRDLVARLVAGNVAQGLEVIVRHPDHGAVVEPETEPEAIDPRAWMSAIRMYVNQVSLAYIAKTKDRDALLGGDGATSALLTASASTSKLSEPNKVPINAHLPNSRSLRSTDLQGDPLSKAAAKRPKFFHVWLDVKSISGSPCASDETIELYFSLYNKADARFLTEEFCVVVAHDGTPARGTGDDRLGRMRTMFRDLSQHDVQDPIFLVCRIVRNGVMRIPATSTANGAATSHGASLHAVKDTDSVATSTSGAAGVDGELTFASPDANGEYPGMTHTLSSGLQSVRRPFGCGVVEVVGFGRPETTDPLTSAPTTSTIPVFAAINEAAFPTLHEDIIASRLKEIQRTPKGESLAVNLKVFFGDAVALAKEHPNMLADVAPTSRLGFPDVVFPDDVRNEIFLKLWSGDFPTLGTSNKVSTSAKAVEVAVEVRTAAGQVLEKVISRGSGEPKVTRYNSVVYRGNGQPTWGELLRLDIAQDRVQDCHLFFTFRNRTEKVKGGVVSLDKPFAFAFLPFVSPSKTFIADGAHDLGLFRSDKRSAEPDVYLGSLSSPDGNAQLAPIKDSFLVRTFLCSTYLTQDETLLRLMKWDNGLLDRSDDVHEVLAKLRFASEVEICKFLRVIFDALFGILASPQNDSSQWDAAIFTALVTLLSIVSDRRFTNFKPVVDVYIEEHFASRTAAVPLMRSLERLLDDPTSSEQAQALRAAIKVWSYLLRFIIRSRQLQRSRDLGLSSSPGVTADAIESKFKEDLSMLLMRVTHLMTLTTPSSIIGTQTLAVQHFPSLITDLAKCYEPEELLDITNNFCDAIAATAGKIVIWKLLLQAHIVMSPLFDSATCRSQLVPKLAASVRHHIGRFEDFSATQNSSVSARDAVRVSWLEGIRISVTVLAAALDRLHEALIDPDIIRDRNALAQEQDNVEFLLGLLPRLLQSFKELENPVNVEAINRARTTAAVVTPVPAIFPTAYPFSLLSTLPGAPDVSANSTTQICLGEVAAVVTTLLTLAPRRLLSAFFDGQLEIEGRSNFVGFLRELFQVCSAILEDKVYPEKWLNINVLAHRAVFKLAEIAGVVLERNFVPERQSGEPFGTLLWADFFTMLHRLLASPHLVIEDFPPQRRRVVWRLAGDIRGEGSRVLTRAWDAIGVVEGSADGTPVGGFQGQFVPSMVEPVLELCLSHHDELRSNAVAILHTMIVNEYHVNSSFTVIADEVIDKLDQLIGNSGTKGDELSRTFFVTQLRRLFDASPVDERLAVQVAAFLESVNQFLELLLGVRGLPPGDEFIDDRVIGTLKLMSFIRNIGRSAIYIRYVHKLVSFHASSDSFTEAGLAMKLHADLHEWDPNKVVEAMPDLNLPKQTEFARKETLYLRILDLLGKGQAWESAVEICKELQTQYEHVTFDYARLSEILTHQASLYEKIVKSDRFFSHYFRVAFYGQGFPTSVQNRQFVYRGHEWEKYAAFCERIHNKHPNAQILKTATIPTEQLQFAEGQFIHIVAVTAEPDRTSIIFTNAEVPNAVRVYYENNATNTFSYSRPFSKTSTEAVGNNGVLAWVEKTYLVCEDAFPTVLQRSEVVELRVLELSPIENAVLTVDEKTRELETLMRRYIVLSKDRTAKLNTNPLSMALNGAVDAPVNGGIPIYRSTFLSPAFVKRSADQAATVEQLRDAIDRQTVVIDDCLHLHGRICPPEMRSFHTTLEQFFEKNFSEEIGRLPDRAGGSSLNESRLTSQESDDLAPLPSSFDIVNGTHKRNYPSFSGSVGRQGTLRGRGRADSTVTVNSLANTLTSGRAVPRMTGGIDSAPPQTNGFHSAEDDRSGSGELGTLARRASMAASTAALSDLRSPTITTAGNAFAPSQLSSSVRSVDSTSSPSTSGRGGLLPPALGSFGRGEETLRKTKSNERRSILGMMRAKKSK